MKLQIPSPEEVFSDELTRPGNWIVANLTTNADWPVKRQSTEFFGHTMWIIPVMRGFYPGIATNIPEKEGRSKVSRLLMRFLSALMWVEGKGAAVDYMTGGNLPRPMGRSERTGYAIRAEFDLSLVPEINNEKASLAVALMREGRILNHPAYAFLSFYRAFEASVSPKQREQWILSLIPNLSDHGARSAVDSFLQSGKSTADIPRYLYESCRHAIAHARQMPVVHPDDLEDSRRLHNINPLMEALAEAAIERELGVKTSQTVWREHLYELDGWKKKLGPEFVAAAMDTATAVPRELDLPCINVRLYGKEPYAPFERMEPVEAHLSDTKLVLTYANANRSFAMRFAIDVPNERLEFDVYDGLYFFDDGSAEFAGGRSELERFVRDYFANGCLTIFDADSAERLSKKDAFIPVNIIPNFDRFNKTISKWRLEEARRRNLKDPL